MTIKTESWHYKWYADWLANGGGNAPSYKENLCHYVRVLLFWAPATWIDQHTFWDWGKLTERAFFGAGVLYFVAVFGFLLVLAAVTQTTKFLMAIGSLGGLLGSIGLLILFVRTMRGKRLEVPGTVKLAASYAVAKKRRICPFIEFDQELRV